MKKILYIAAATIMCACGRSGEEFDATGTFEATEVTVSAEAAGKILALDANEGSKVTQGQMLGYIDSLQLYLQKLQLQRNMASVLTSRPSVATQIATLREQIAKQQSERTRIENLLREGAATTKQLDDINSSIAVLESQLSAQQSTLNKSVSSLDAQSSAIEIQVAQIDDRLSKCRIVAPITGTILTKYAEAGELASVGRPLLKLADTDNLFLRAYVTSGQLADAKLGQQVKVKADFGGDKQREYKGTISWIASQSEFTPKSIQTQDDRENLVYAMKISVMNDGYIKIGMYGYVIF